MSIIGPHNEAGIAIYTGLPGGGKSFQAAQLQVEWLESGNPVLSNLEVKALPFRWIKPKYGKFVLLEDSDFLEFDHVVDEDGEPAVELRLMQKIREVLLAFPGSHPLVLIDEAPNYYASQDFKSNPKAMKAFLRQHRHLGVSVVAVAQNWAMLDNNFNRLCQEYRHHKNLVKDSKLNMLLWWFGDNFHLAYSMPNAGGKPFTAEIYNRKWFRIRKSRAAVYSTVQMHASNLPGQVRRAKKTGIRLVFLAIFLCFVSFVLYGVYSLASWKPEVVGIFEATESGVQLPQYVFDAFWLDGNVIVCELQSINGDVVHVMLDRNSVSSIYDLAEMIGKVVEIPVDNAIPVAQLVSQYY